MRWPCLWLVACGIWTLQIHSILPSLPAFGCPLGWPAGVSSIPSMGEQTPSVWQTRGPHKVLPMCSRLLGRLPSDETPGVSSLGCAMWLSGLACWCYCVVCILPRFSHHTCPILLSYLVSDTRVPHFLVYRSSNQPDVAVMMYFLLLFLRRKLPIGWRKA
jgi:hypothetical protein